MNPFLHIGILFLILSSLFLAKRATAIPMNATKGLMIYSVIHTAVALAVVIAMWLVY